MESIEQTKATRERGLESSPNRTRFPRSGPTRQSPNQRQRIVELLRARGAAGVTTADFLRMPVARYSSRIRELRQIGFVIRVDRINFTALARDRLEDGRARLGGRVVQALVNATTGTIIAGTSEIQRTIISTRGLGLPR